MKFEALKDKKRNVILSTDIAGDCDDVGAIKVMHSYADELGYDIIGVCNCTSRREGTATVYALNKFLGRPDIPLGEYQKHTLPAVAESSKYIDEISARFGKDCHEPLPAAKFYRKLLANAEDDSVIIITIGFYTDMAELLMSGPDEYSPLSGVELMHRKVNCVVSMALKYPCGLEFNIRHAPDAAKTFFDNVPTNVFISDFDLGRGFRTGFYGIDKEEYKDNPVFESYRLFAEAYNLKNYDNNSYDLTAVQFAAVGEGEFYRIDSTPYRIEFYDDADQFTSNQQLKDAANRFVEDPHGNVYLIKAVDNAVIKAELDRRMIL